MSARFDKLRQRVEAVGVGSLRGKQLLMVVGG